MEWFRRGQEQWGWVLPKPMLCTKLLNHSLTCAELAGVTNRTFWNLMCLYLVSNIRFKTKQLSETLRFVASFFDTSRTFLTTVILLRLFFAICGPFRNGGLRFQCRCSYVRVTCTHACAHTHTCAHTHAHMHACTRAHMHTHAHAHTHAHIPNFAPSLMQVCPYCGLLCLRVKGYKCMWKAHAHTHTHTHTHKTRTHTQNTHTHTSHRLILPTL